MVICDTGGYVVDVLVICDTGGYVVDVMVDMWWMYSCVDTNGRYEFQLFTIPSPLMQ